MSSVEPSNLKTLFNTALSLQSQLNSIQPTSTEYTTTLQTALTKLSQCRQLASSLALFSENESLDEISTYSIPYLAIDYHIANLVPRTTLPSNANNPAVARKILVQEAQDAHGRFLSLLEDYSLLSPSERKLYASWTRNRSTFSLQDQPDPSSRREAKIRQYKREKELQAQLEVLETASNVPGADEDVVRKLRIAELSLFAHRSLQALDMLSQEMLMLSRAPGPEEELRMRKEADERERERTRDGYSERLDSSLKQLALGAKGGPILNAQGKPLQPFTLLDKRRDLKDGVFRSGHRLPTMSIDEYLEAEKARGGIIEGGGEPEEKEIDEDDMEAADREVMKKREWDEFVEANPKGSGNTLNRG